MSPPVKAASRLTPAESKLKFLFKQSYAEFWNNVKFTRGWVRPLFIYEEVEPLLDVAAHISAHIRNVVEQEEKTELPSILGGSSREYLWSLNKHPRDFPEEFVRKLVHHTFRDCSGYYPGLSEKRIDHFLNRYLRHYPLNPMENTVQSALDKLKDQWLNTDKLLHEFIASEVDKTPFISRIQKVAQSLAVIDLEIEEWLGKVHQTELEPSPSSSETESPDEKAAEVSAPQGEEKKVEEKKPEDKKPEEPKPEEPKPEEPKPEEKKPEEKKPEEEKKDEADQKASIEIVKVTEDVNKLSSEVKSLTDHTELLKIEELSSNPEQAVQEIEGYQKQCLRYSELLMRDLLSLDQLHVGQETRPLRKKAVTHIQQLLDNLDSVSGKLRKQLQEMKTKLAEQEEKKREEEAAKEKEEQTKRKEEEEKRQKEAEEKPQEEQRSYPVTTYGAFDDDEEEIDLTKSQEALDKKSESVQQAENKWGMLKLQPKFQVQEKRDSYLISAYVPGMKQEDIKLSLRENASVLTIEGLRLPTKEEEALMVNQIRSRFPNIDPKHLDVYVLRMGAGHFGKFSENYRLSRDVDAEDISASYERGVLQVRLGKKKAAFKPNPFAAYDPRVARPGRSNPRSPFDFPTGFFNDPELWW